MTSLSDIGEFGLIKRFSGKFRKNLPAGITGIGDDCAVMRLNNKESLLATTDLLTEDRHFIFDKISAYELGWKSLAVSISDIAAMGGLPESAFLSISIPDKVSLKWMDGFFDGVSSCCSKYRMHLLGGDTTKSPDRLVVNFTVLGKCRNDRIKMRSTAKPGHLICVTGTLGDSGAGLKILLDGMKAGELEKKLIKRHHLPDPHIGEGRYLGSLYAVSAMMDVSDGVDSDIRRMMEASDTGAEIDLGKLPVSDELTRICRKKSWDAASIALSGGEDYCLLATINPLKYKAISIGFEKKFGKQLKVIGKITEDSGKLIYFKNGKKVTIRSRGFDHFHS